VVRCERVTLPVSLALNLNDAATQVADVTLFGFDGGVRDLTTVTLITPGQRSARTVKALTLSHADGQPPPYLKLTPGGALGTAVLELDRGAEVTASGNVLRVVSHGRGDVRVAIQSDSAALDGARYAIAEVGERSLAEFSLAAAGTPPGLGAALQAMPPNGAEI